MNLYIYIYIYIYSHFYICIPSHVYMGDMCVCVCVCGGALVCGWCVFVSLRVCGPVGCRCRIHWLHLCKGVRLPHLVSRYDTKQLDGDASVILELWEKQSTSLLLSFPGPLSPGMVAPDRVLPMSQIEINCAFVVNWMVWDGIVLTFKLRTYAKLNCLK